MAKYEVTLSIEPQIIIENTEKFYDFFVKDGCEFGKYMYKFETIEEACQQFLSMLFFESKRFDKNNSGEYVYSKFIEGIGGFENLSGDLWTAQDSIKEDNENLYGGISFILPNDGDVEVEWSCRKVG